MIKRIRTWLEEIEDDLKRKEALQNYDAQNDKDDENEPVETLSEAIFGAFDWSDTPEGFDYWDDYNKSIS